MTIRLDPKLRYLTELAARKQRRTVSSFIEWAIERALDNIILRETYDEYHGGNIETSLGDASETLWDVDEPDRLVKLALSYPELLTHDEQILWKLIRECGWLWRGTYNREGYWKWDLQEDAFDFSRLREKWDAFKQVATGEADKNTLPKWVERKPASSKIDLAKLDFPPPVERKAASSTSKPDPMDFPLPEDDIPF